MLVIIFNTTLGSRCQAITQKKKKKERVPGRENRAGLQHVAQVWIRCITERVLFFVVSFDYYCCFW